MNILPFLLSTSPQLLLSIIIWEYIIITKWIWNEYFNVSVFNNYVSCSLQLVSENILFLLEPLRTLCLLSSYIAWPSTFPKISSKSKFRLPATPSSHIIQLSINNAITIRDLWLLNFCYGCHKTHFVTTLFLLSAMNVRWFQYNKGFAFAQTG